MRYYIDKETGRANYVMDGKELRKYRAQVLLKEKARKRKIRRNIAKWLLGVIRDLCLATVIVLTVFTVIFLNI